MNVLRRVCLRGLRIGENYDFFFLKPIFKIGSLNLFSVKLRFVTMKFEISRADLSNKSNTSSIVLAQSARRINRIPVHDWI